ncbi:M28 family metallopeptidase [Blastococcus sp. CT_GayMR16]|uniref:M28 family metallopeptidase n=1 Tax=Blastococcus sp. CT_GayMR16 TaxID=2559607 RepID=UPI0010748F28|nr:M28 family metallopeptidase [Blastococcus sp. CT_GayMR16]TFV83015.1 M20/M25/M40 family metallo-hydrolase [Blastococcus sp. CT_GayMR16]
MNHAHQSRRTRLIATSAAGLLAVAGTLATAAPAAAGGGKNSCEQRNNNTISKLLECVNGTGVKEHLSALQEIADANGGNRASGSPGYAASADYVESTLEKAGYTVTRQDFEFPFYETSEDPTFAQTAPTPTTYVYGTDFSDMSLSGSGTPEAPAVAVDIEGPDSGCEAADFAGFPVGAIAIIKRGACDFGLKAANAEAAGATGAVIYNDGAAPDRFGLIGGTLGTPVGIPVLDTTNAIGLTLPGTTLAIDLQAISEIRSTQNLTAELPGKSSEGVVMVGAHLDSVSEGPGINDNGTGTAAILELAQNLHKARPDHPVRFAWWGAEEAGLVGSQAYVDSLTEEEFARIGSYLNFDMLGSPNFARFVYDGDGSTFEAPEGYVTPESSAIEAIFEQFYDSRGLAYEDTEFDGRSDYQAFADAGIPSGGLFSGAEDIKSAEQATRYGGTAGQPFDPCYHQACDDIGNINAEVLDQNADAVAYATLTLAGPAGSNGHHGNGNGHGQGNGHGSGHGGGHRGHGAGSGGLAPAA